MSINWSEKNTAEIELFFSTDVKKGLTQEQYMQAKSQYGENIIDADILDRQNFYGLKNKKRNTKAMLYGSFGIAGILYFLMFIILKIMGFEIKIYLYLLFYLFLTFSAFILSVRAGKKYEYLHKIARPKALVIRQEKRKKIFVENIVPGDVIILSAGDIIPADARLVFAENLSCIHINRDGKPVRAAKKAGILKSNPAASRGYSGHEIENMPVNIVYAADVVDRGNATAVVIATGKETYIANTAADEELEALNANDENTDAETDENSKINNNNISETAGEEKRDDGYSVMQKSANKLSGNFFLTSVFLSMLIIFTGIMQDRDFIVVILTCLTALAASFSEQISIIADFAVLHGMHRLSKFGILVKKTSIIDEINNIDTIIAKKNESFTQDRMELKKISDRDVSFENSPEIGYILSCMTMCASVTESESRGQNNKNKIIYSGSAVDVAVFEALEKCGLNYDGVSQVYQKVGKTIYNPANGIKSAIVLKEGKSNLICFGEASVILERCVRTTESGKLINFDRQSFNFYKDKIGDLYKEHDLIMAVAAKDFNRLGNINAAGAELETGLDFLGFASFAEPKTSAVFESIDYLKKSGVNPVMFTDSDTIYSRSAAVKFGVAQSEAEAQIINDDKISRMGDSLFFINSDKFKLFAPISLDNRIKLLKALKFKKKSPAITVNDIEEISLLNEPCVVFTSVNTETGILKNKASVITKNLTVSTILQTVKNSVLIYRNICALTHFISAMFVSQYLLILFALLLNGAYILNPFQILWAGLGAGYVFAISICFNEENKKWQSLRTKIKEYDKPKKFNGTILKYGIFYGFLIFLFAVIAFMLCLAMKESVMAGSMLDKIKKYINSGKDAGIFAVNIRAAQTAAFVSYIVSLASFALHYIKSSRFFDFKVLKNKIYIIALILNILAGLAVIFIPAIRNVFDFGEISAAILGVSALTGLLPLIITAFFRKLIFFERK